jgi:hypothetical protein
VAGGRDDPGCRKQRKRCQDAEHDPSPHPFPSVRCRACKRASAPVARWSLPRLARKIKWLISRLEYRAYAA